MIKHQGTVPDDSKGLGNVVCDKNDLQGPIKYCLQSFCLFMDNQQWITSKKLAMKYISDQKHKDNVLGVLRVHNKDNVFRYK